MAKLHFSIINVFWAHFCEKRNVGVVHNITFQISDLFVDPTTLTAGFAGGFQLLFLFVAYGYVLMVGSGLISDGSELLLLVPSLAGIVGSVVLPVLGAVPDGAIVLFSGLGDDAQTQLSVGVGALAGSTIMLLTVPWLLSIVAGRVTLKNGVGNYKKPKGFKGQFVKLEPGTEYSLLHSGVSVSKNVKTSGIIMLGTAISYMLIQGPAFALKCFETDQDIDCHSSGERYWALGGFLCCFILFCMYLFYQVKSAGNDAVVESTIQKVRIQAITGSLMSLRGVFAAVVASGGGGKAEPFVQGGSMGDFRDLVRMFFRKYDRNKDGQIDKGELCSLLADFNEDTNMTDKLLDEIDTNHDGGIDFEEFVAAMQKFVSDENMKSFGAVELGSPVKDVEKGYMPPAADGSASASGQDAAEEEDDEDDDDEEEEVPEDLAHLSPKQQMRRILLRSAWMMGLGTLMVLLFSDPMVGILSEIGNRINVPPFYVSFVLAPLASNASELIAAYNYALKKTSKSITISFQTLEGAACMNNTFCLGIFLAIVFFKSLKWEFAAETISILFVEIVMFFFSLKTTHTLLDALLVISLYPISLILVAVLEKVGLN